MVNYSNPYYSHMADISNRVLHSVQLIPNTQKSILNEYCISDRDHDPEEAYKRISTGRPQQSFCQKIRFMSSAVIKLHGFFDEDTIKRIEEVLTEETNKIDVDTSTNVWLMARKSPNEYVYLSVKVSKHIEGTNLLVWSNQKEVVTYQYVAALIQYDEHRHYHPAQ